MEPTAGFGGGWTEEKLESLGKYLQAYATIFAKNPRARFFKTVYVDAFAGSGYIRKAGSSGSQGGIFADLAVPEVEDYIKGSAVRALEVNPGFGQYIFIESDAERCKELERLKTTHPGKKIEVENADANDYLRKWCKETDWRTTRAVVFLDPYGMDVEWSSLQEIARTKAIDLWLLFPLGIGVLRLLTNAEPPPPGWAQALNRVLGTEDWKERFYPPRQRDTLFGPEGVQTRLADAESVGSFFLGRLKTLFAKVAEKPLVLKNSKNSPLYLLCFAAGNPKAAPLAVRIAQDIIGE